MDKQKFVTRKEFEDFKLEFGYLDSAFIRLKDALNEELTKIEVRIENIEEIANIPKCDNLDDVKERQYFWNV